MRIRVGLRGWCFGLRVAMGFGWGFRSACARGQYKLVGASRGPNKQGTDCRFHEVHHAHFRAHGLSYPPQYSLHYTTEQIKRLQTLPERCREIIYFWDKTKPIPEAPHEQAIDVGQTIFRVPHCEDATPCLLPKSLMWLRRSFRLLEPPEA